MFGFKIRLEVLYFSTFRKTRSTSLILTYLIPPITTIRGMFSNALGLIRDDYSLQDKIKIGIAVKKFGFKNVELAKILKLKEEKRKMPSSDYPSSPMFREFVVNPQYDIFVSGDRALIERLHKSLMKPVRPLYIGQSDDVADISVGNIIQITSSRSKVIDSVIFNEMVENSYMDKIPYRFVFNDKKNRYDVEYVRVSIPKKLPARLDKDVEVFQFEDEFVEVI